MSNAEQDDMADGIFDRLDRAEALIEKWSKRAKGSSSCLRGQGGQYELEQCIRELTLALRPAREEQPGDGDGK